MIDFRSEFFVLDHGTLEPSRFLDKNGGQSLFITGLIQEKVSPAGDFCNLLHGGHRIGAEGAADMRKNLHSGDADLLVYERI